MNDATATPNGHAESTGELAQVVSQLTDELLGNPELADDEILARHPEFADQLVELLPPLRTIAALPLGSGSLQCAVVSAASLLEDETHVLGDFRILRELGRGGMGAVYEAKQISMGRTVALKVLPFAALAHEKALQRFRNEVRAVAALDHPHIVSVYSVGEERGINYYAMQLVRGQSLAEVIRTQRTSSKVGGQRSEGKTGNDARTTDSADLPGGDSTHGEQARLSTVVDSRRETERYRTAARLAIQAAEALQHAHDQGVLHRDIKPGNLLVDADGQLHITDFGLARIEADAGMTMTGDIIGTLRYMAPEQALAKRVVIDHRADIYGLGATLYELLVLQPAFGETDRSELLKQIAFDEPQPLRKIDRHIPADLETIVRKAMEKNPDDRYVAAQDLADDLQRHLNDQPIRARPPTLMDYMVKWSRRHVAVVSAAALVLLVATVGLAIGTWKIGSARNQAVVAQESAETAASRARRNLDLAIESLDEVYTELVGEELANIPGQTKNREQFLAKALGFYQRFARQNEMDEQSWPQTGRAYLLQGRILDELDRPGEAEAAYIKSAKILGSLVTRFPEVPEYRYLLAEWGLKYGATLSEAGWTEGAIEVFRQAFRLLEPAGDPGTDESLARQLESLRDASLLANIYLESGKAYVLGNEFTNAHESFGRAIRLWRGLIAQGDAHANYVRSLGTALSEQALAYDAMGDVDRAIELAREAIAQQERGLLLEPKSAAGRRHLRDTIHQMGNLVGGQRHFKQAVEFHLRGNKLAAALAADFPGVVEDQWNAAFSHFSLSNALLAGGRPDQAAKHYHQCLMCWRSVLPDSWFFERRALFYQIASNHPGSIVHPFESDGLSVFRKVVADLRGQSVHGWVGPRTADQILEIHEGAPSYHELDARLTCGDSESHAYFTAFHSVIAALSRDDLAAARKALKRAANGKEEALRQFDERVGDIPMLRFLVESFEVVHGHARALTELRQKLGEHGRVNARATDDMHSNLGD